MANVLLFGDDRQSAIRQEIGLPLPDPVAHAEVDGARYVFAVLLDVPRFRALGTLEVTPFEELGLGPGDVITIEPGLYRPGFGGCRIEGVLVVTEGGYELFTDFRTSSPEPPRRPPPPVRARLAAARIPTRTCAPSVPGSDSVLTRNQAVRLRPACVASPG